MNILKPFYFPTGILFILTTLLSPLRAASPENWRVESVYDKMSPKMASYQSPEDLKDPSAEEPSPSFFQKHKKWIIGGAFLTLGACILGGALYYYQSPSRKNPSPPEEEEEEEEEASPLPKRPSSPKPEKELFSAPLPPDVPYWFPKTKKEVNQFLPKKDGTIRTALIKSILTENKEWVKYLLQEGADPNLATADDKKETPLYWAAMLEDRDIAQSLLDHGANIDAKAGSRGYTPLHIATLYDRKKMIELLLSRDAHIDAQDHLGKTALFYAKSSEIVSFLLQHDISFRISDNQNNTVLHNCVTDEFLDTAEKLKILNLLLEARVGRMSNKTQPQGLNVNKKNKAGNTPLHLAQDSQVALFLLDNEADKTITNEKGETPEQSVEKEEVKVAIRNYESKIEKYEC